MRKKICLMHECQDFCNRQHHCHDNGRRLAAQQHLLLLLAKSLVLLSMDRLLAFSSHWNSVVIGHSPVTNVGREKISRSINQRARDNSR